MLTINIIAFIATTQPEQARVFYREVLGLRLVEDTPFSLVFDANLFPFFVS
ncbi:MAG: VOC family protein [Chloroflexota bacterium]|nr:VOC family protein [Chloroflexota bacterium]